MQTLNQDIKEKSFKKIYLLYGDEPFLVGSYKKKLREAITGGDTMNFNYFEGKNPDVKEIISLADTMPFFADRRLILVDGSGFFKSAQEELAAYLPQMPDTTCLVFAESEVDKRNRLYKRVKELGYAAELNKQDTAQLMRWAAGILGRDGRKISRPVMEYFLERTGDDMENIRMELEKLVCYTMGRDVITKEDVDAVGTVHVTSRVFDMVAAIVAGNTKKAMDLYEDLLTLKEPPMRILFLIARQFNQLLQIKELTAAGKDKGAMASALKVPPFAVGKLTAQARAFTRDQILSWVTLCVETEEAVKTGRSVRPPGGGASDCAEDIEKSNKKTLFRHTTRKSVFTLRIYKLRYPAFLLSHSAYSFGQTGYFSGSSILVIYALGSSLVDFACSSNKRSLCSSLVTGSNCSFNLLHISFHLGSDRFVSGSLCLSY